MQTNDSQTPQTSQNLAETQPADAKGFRPVEARQVNENKTAAQILESLAETYLRRSNNCFETGWKATATVSRERLWGRAEIFLSVWEELQSEITKLSDTSTGGASAHIEPSLNDGTLRQEPRQ